MYPFFRLTKQLYLAKRAGPIGFDETHKLNLRVRPWDIDPFLDLNNGRILTLMDLGRFAFFGRLGATAMLRKNRWVGSVAGSVIRYRRRITVFQKLELRTRIIGWDDRFTYFDHSFWRGEECCAQAVIRVVVSNKDGIVPTERLTTEMGMDPKSPEMPDWVQAWQDTENMRPWPPV